MILIKEKGEEEEEEEDDDKHNTKMYDFVLAMWNSRFPNLQIFIYL